MSRIPPGELGALLMYLKERTQPLGVEIPKPNLQEIGRKMLSVLQMCNDGDYTVGDLLTALRDEIDRKNAKSQMRQKEDALS